MTAKTPSTPASKIERTPASTPGGPRGKEEKIVVTVRLRPLSKREQSARDQVAWECIDDHTIVYKQPAQDRSTQPASFTFGIKLIFIFHYKFTLSLSSPAIQRDSSMGWTHSLVVRPSITYMY